jgi:hypothetical protein
LTTEAFSKIENIEQAKKLSKAVHKLLRAIEIALLIIFGSVELWPFVGELLQKGLVEVVHGLKPADFVWDGTLIIYFASWIFGAESDAEVQGEVYLTAPNKGQLTAQDLMIAGSIAGAFAVLLLLRHKPHLLAGAMTLFWLGNILAWRYLVNLLKTTINKSRATYRRNKEYIGLEKLNVVQRYISGQWQWWRFGLGAVLIIAVDVFAFMDVIDIEMGLVFFVGFVESWIWMERARTNVSLRILDDLHEKYGNKMHSETI